MNFSPSTMDRDGLTNLLSRSKLLATLEERIHGGTSISVILINLDRFRLVNENFTYAVGDTVLQEVSRRILSHAPANGLVGRFGGNEFALACFGLNDEDALALAERIRTSLRESHSISGADIVVTASVGLANGHASDRVEQLLQRAEVLTQQAKGRGRNQVSAELNDVPDKTLSPLIVETLLRNALQNDDLEIYYQPKIQTNSMQVTGAEALCRWKHAEHGDISPQHFIPVAESSDLILPVDEFVLRAVCRQGSQWLKNGYRVRTSVNVSGRQFLQPGFANLVKNILEETGMNPSLLELEITERTAMHDVEQVVHVLKCLRNLGVRTAIDDFGIGYSSLSYLMKFPVQTLKIDRSFTAGIQSAFNQDLVIGAIISLAKSLNLNVVAEGVETMQQLDFLRDQKCDEIQGYLLGEPVPPQSFHLTSFASAPKRRGESWHSSDPGIISQQLNELEWMERIGVAVTNRPRLNHLVNILPDFIVERVPFDRFSIEIFNLEKDYCSIHEASLRDDLPARVIGSFVSVAHSGLAFIERTKTPSTCGDILNNPEFTEDYALCGEGIRSILRVPLARGNEVYGMLSLQSTHVNVYSDNDKRLMQRLATRLSDSIYAAQSDLRLETIARDADTGCFQRSVLTSLKSVDDPTLLLSSICERPFPPVSSVSVIYLAIANFDKLTLDQANQAMRHLARLVHANLPQHAISIKMGARDILVVFFGDASLASFQLVTQLSEQLQLVRARAKLLGDDNQAFDVHVGQTAGAWTQIDALYRLAVRASSESDPLSQRHFQSPDPR